MRKKKLEGISFFERYLTVWVILCIRAGLLIGKFLPVIPQTLNRFEYAKVSIPVAVLIWLMIYPMMLKIDFESIKRAASNIKGVTITTTINWIIKPFTMYIFVVLFFKYVFKKNKHYILYYFYVNAIIN